MATTAASKRARKPADFKFLPIIAESGLINTSVKLSFTKPSSSANKFKPSNCCRVNTFEISPVKISLSPATNTSSGVTGEIKRPPRTTSTKNNESKFRKPLASTLLPINFEVAEISASKK